MAGRRDRQKQERRARILRAAGRVFAGRGYAEVRMEEIARRAGVAVGTLYNYFPAKADVALALAGEETREAVEAGAVWVRHPPHDADAAVAGLLERYLLAFARRDRSFWRSLAAAALGDAERVTRGLLPHDARLVAQLAELVARLQERGRIDPEADAGRAGLVLYGHFLSWLLIFAARESVDLDIAREELRRAVGITLRGLLPSDQAGAQGHRTTGAGR